ncbi:hypothetical protein BRPE64_BCDS03320 [Caballeronia insecticola]|uniref:Uncharacterized protein n=1 Tax=Caballeronia insecticola TaxID=758793 RepID=R4WKB9_9BURK|nr:hypothetical protein BRPE64_BCDS03320 [Caballeronia insecticola]
MTLFCEHPGIASEVMARQRVEFSGLMWQNFGKRPIFDRPVKAHVKPHRAMHSFRCIGNRRAPLR